MSFYPQFAASRTLARQLLCLLSLVALLPTELAWGQDDDLATPVLYQVEVLIFRNVDQSRTSPELPKLAEAAIDDVLDQQLAQLGAAASDTAQQPVASDAETVPEPALWTAVDEDARVLNREAARLTRLDAYELLAHLAWIQPAEDVSLARTIDAKELGANRSSGTFKLYQKRYLHLAVDLSLPLSAPDEQNWLLREIAAPPEAPATIVGSRRMRLGKLIYFDQPAFGVIATVKKVEASDQDVT